jgi:hypothetical protein
MQLSLPSSASRHDPHHAQTTDQGEAVAHESHLSGSALRNVGPATVSRPSRLPLAGVHPVKRRGRTLQLVESAATGFG